MITNAVLVVATQHDADTCSYCKFRIKLISAFWRVFLIKFCQKSLKFWLPNNRGGLSNKSDFSTLNSSVQDPSINKQKIQKNLDFYCFVTNVNVPKVSNKPKKRRKNWFFAILKATEEKSRIRIRNPVYGSEDPDAYLTSWIQNTDY